MLVLLVLPLLCVQLLVLEPVLVLVLGAPSERTAAQGGRLDTHSQGADGLQREGMQM